MFKGLKIGKNREFNRLRGLLYNRLREVLCYMEGFMEGVGGLEVYKSLYAKMVELDRYFWQLGVEELSIRIKELWELSGMRVVEGHRRFSGELYSRLELCYLRVDELKKLV